MPRTNPNPIRPQTINPQDWSARVAAHAAARAAREEFERNRSQAGNGGKVSRHGLTLEIAELEALIALESDARAYERSAADVEGLRSLLLAELSIAREAYSRPAPAQPAPLAAATPEAILAAVAEQERYSAALEAHKASLAPIARRLSLIYHFCREAAGMIARARKAAQLPAARTVVPSPGNILAAPGADAIDQHAALIEAQRMPPAGQAATHHELKLRQLRRDLEELDLAAAAEQEAARIEALPPQQRRIEIDRINRATAAE